jgi:putative ABC transport system permease protein
MHTPVLLFTLIVSIATGLLAAVFPAWRSSRGDLHEDLAGGNRSFGPGRQARARWVLVSGEVALSVLLPGAACCTAASGRVARRRIRRNAHRPPSLPRARYDRIEKVTAFYHELESRVAPLPGVTEVSAANHVPLNGALASADYRTPEMSAGSDTALPTASYRMVTPRYFRAMGIPLLSGRIFDDHDDTDAPRVAIISQALARRSFNRKNPVGSRI